MQEFIDAEAKNVAIHDLHPAHFPVGSVFADQGIKVLLVFEHSVDQPHRERFHVLSRLVLMPEFVQPNVRFTVNVVLKQDL